MASGRVLIAWLLVGVGACAGGDGPPRVDERAGANGQERERDRAAYDRWRQPERLVAALSLEPGHRVADIGAGHGYLEPYLAAAIGAGGRIVATDVDAAALAVLAERARDQGLPVETRVVAADDPGLEAAAFDRVLLAQVDHLLDEPATYLRRLVPALAPSGRIAISNRVDRESALRAAVAEAGLRVVERYELPGQFVLVLAPPGAEEPAL